MQSTNCDFCGKAVPVAAEAHIGERQCCDECRSRLTGDLCAACNGTGVCCDHCGDVCRICNGEGLRSGAPCPYAGAMWCDSDDCAPCTQRLLAIVDDTIDAEREHQQLRQAGVL